MATHTHDMCHCLLYSKFSAKMSFLHNSVLNSIDSVLRYVGRVNEFQNDINNLWPHVFGPNKPLTKQFIEIRGPSKRGIGLVLQEFLFRICLGSTHIPKVSGLDGRVIYFDLTGDFREDLFRKYLEKGIKRHFHDRELVNIIVANALTNLIIVRPEILTNPDRNSRYNDLIKQRDDFTAIVIDNIDEYKPGLSFPGETNPQLKDKVLYLKYLLNDSNILPIYLHECKNGLEPGIATFTETSVVLDVHDYNNEGGVIIRYYEKDKKYEVIFADNNAMRD